MVVRRNCGVLPEQHPNTWCSNNVIKLTAIRLAYPCVVATATRAVRPLGCYMVKPHGPLVRVSSTHCCASTSRLSTSSSSRVLQGAQGPREVSS